MFASHTAGNSVPPCGLRATKSLDPIVVTFLRECLGHGTVEFALNCPVPEAWTIRRTKQSTFVIPALLVAGEGRGGTESVSVSVLSQPLPWVLSHNHQM